MLFYDAVADKDDPDGGRREFDPSNGRAGARHFPNRGWANNQGLVKMFLFFLLTVSLYLASVVENLAT